jgi:hypothetical protein
MKIRILKLKERIDEILSLPELKPDASIPADSDDCYYYWDVTAPAGRYKNNGATRNDESVPKPTLGNLGDDWNQVKGGIPPISATVDADARAIAAVTALIQLSSLLRAIGDNPEWVF